MADNVELNSGSGGAVLATDDVAGVHYQIVKLAYGAPDAADVVSDSNPLPIDDAGGSLTVDVGTALPAGDNNIGNVDLASSIPAGTNNIGDVDVLSLVPGTGATALGKAEDAAHSDGDTGVMVLAVRRDADTTLADTTGDYAPLQVNAGGQLKTAVVSSALPSGASTAANQTTIIGHVDGIEGLLTTIDSDTGTLAGAVIGSEMQVDVVAALPTGDNNIGNVDIASALPAGDNNIGNVDLASAIPAGTNNIGDVDVLTIAAGSNLIGNVGIGVRTSGGATPVQFLDVDESEDEVKGSAGQLYFIHAMNLANAKRYLKVYDETAATCDVGTDTPKFTFTLPTQGDTNGAGFTICFPMGIAFANGICIAATTGFAVADTGAPGANEVIVNVGYA